VKREETVRRGEVRKRSKEETARKGKEDRRRRGEEVRKEESSKVLFIRKKDIC